MRGPCASSTGRLEDRATFGSRPRAANRPKFAAISVAPRGTRRRAGQSGPNERRSLISLQRFFSLLPRLCLPLPSFTSPPRSLPPFAVLRPLFLSHLPPGPLARGPFIECDICNVVFSASQQSVELFQRTELAAARRYTSRLTPPCRSASVRVSTPRASDARARAQNGPLLFARRSLPFLLSIVLGDFFNYSKHPSPSFWMNYGCWCRESRHLPADRRRLGTVVARSVTTSC